MSIRLVIALITTPLELAAFFLVSRYILPHYDLDIPLPVVIGLMAAWLVWSILTYRLGTRALKRKVLANQTSMIGATGKATTPLHPDGMVRIHGELWQARTESGPIPAGTSIAVIRQERMKLIVQVRPDEASTRSTPA